MRWTVAVPMGPVGTFAERARAELAAVFEGVPVELSRCVTAVVCTQFEGALRSATMVLDRVIAPDHGAIVVTLSGCADPAHRPRVGYGRDSITVTVAQA